MQQFPKSRQSRYETQWAFLVGFGALAQEASCSLGFIECPQVVQLFELTDCCWAVGCLTSEIFWSYEQEVCLLGFARQCLLSQPDAKLQALVCVVNFPLF